MTTVQTQEQNLGCVVLLDDEEPIRKAFQGLFQDLEIDLELKTCKNYSEYDALMGDVTLKKRVKCLIMDLSNEPKEVVSKDYQAHLLIKKEYDENRIPIFIHSGNLEYYDKFQDEGTVFRVAKSGESGEAICNKIKLMHESSFLDVFCKDGYLDNSIMDEIHAAFVGQFKSDEIEGIINSIKEVNLENYQERVREVFQRIAVRSLFSNLTSSSVGVDDTPIRVRLNAIEHYYRRKNNILKFWTGDVFRKIGSKESCIILTPRCNLEHQNFKELLCCEVVDYKQVHFEAFGSQKVDKDKGEKKGVLAFRASITDDVTNALIGEVFRFLPPTPQFQGGFVDYRTVFSMTIDEFESTYESSPTISLSEELTNDVIRKLTSYLLRGGISETEINEAYHYFEEFHKGKTT